MKPDWFTILVSWTPFILVVAFFAGYLLYLRGGAKRGRLLIEISEQQVTKMRRTNVVLERLAEALEKRSPG